MEKLEFKNKYFFNSHMTFTSNNFINFWTDFSFLLKNHSKERGLIFLSIPYEEIMSHFYDMNNKKEAQFNFNKYFDFYNLNIKNLKPINQKFYTIIIEDIYKNFLHEIYKRRYSLFRQINQTLMELDIYLLDLASFEKKMPEDQYMSMDHHRYSKEYYYKINLLLNDSLNLFKNRLNIYYLRYHQMVQSLSMEQKKVISVTNNNILKYKKSLFHKLYKK